MTNKYLCIHGHFYQPPRENPWLEAIEYQDSAKPFHDWNERIMDECYEPNANSRILDHEKIIAIVNNYSKISFNFGPTLLSWIKDNNQRLLEEIIEADVQSQEAYGGHGNAMAQAYNHMILPLANRRDKYTQIYWGIKDFEHYYHRKPEGLWLAETAVDLESLDLMSELGIKFTILAPNQFKEARALESNEADASFYPGRPYLQKLPSGRSIVLYFYDGEVSQAVAFERLLNQGEHLAQRLLHRFDGIEEDNYLVHIATDGETYGHHHRFGDMGLAYALHLIEQTQEVQLTNYAQHMELQKPEYSVEIHENSSWSCAHGVERWRSNCGCNSGGTPWHQEWRKPLREALDELRDRLIPVFEEQLNPLLKDPWQARNDYIEVIHNRDLLDQYLEKHAQRRLQEEEKQRVLKWMELQRHAMLMYTSCGWFFDELSGIETVQILKYAGRVIQLAHELTQQDFEATFLEKLARAPSNIEEHQNGKVIYEKFVKPYAINLKKVAAHIAASLPFIAADEKNEVYAFSYALTDTQSLASGKSKLMTGHMDITSKITLEQLSANFVVFYNGDQNLISAVIEPQENFNELVTIFQDAFNQGDTFTLLNLFKEHFGDHTISLADLFFDMKMKIMNDIVANSVTEKEMNDQYFLENNLPILDFMKSNQLIIPEVFQLILIFHINKGIIRELEKETPDLTTLNSLIERAEKFNIKLEEDAIGYALSNLLKKQAQILEQDEVSEEQFLQLFELLQFMKKLPWDVNFWLIENKIFKLLTQSANDAPALKQIAELLRLEVS
ncbi:MAG: DUF3536 domain-containing protein [Legionella sp.]|nr:DUF3536 domain-containing protein [Legionella sp.]